MEKRTKTPSSNSSQSITPSSRQLSGGAPSAVATATPNIEATSAALASLALSTPPRFGTNANGGAATD